MAIRHAYSSLLPTCGQSLVEGSTRDQEGLESQSGPLIKAYIMGLGRKMEHLAWR